MTPKEALQEQGTMREDREKEVKSTEWESKSDIVNERENGHHSGGARHVFFSILFLLSLLFPIVIWLTVDHHEHLTHMELPVSQ